MGLGDLDRLRPRQPLGPVDPDNPEGRAQGFDIETTASDYASPFNHDEFSLPPSEARKGADEKTTDFAGDDEPTVPIYPRGDKPNDDPTVRIKTTDTEPKGEF